MKSTQAYFLFLHFPLLSKQIFLFRERRRKIVFVIPKSTTVKFYHMQVSDIRTTFIFEVYKIEYSPMYVAPFLHAIFAMPHNFKIS